MAEDKNLLYERMAPDDLERVLDTTPVAYVPMGTLEFHGWHLPLGFDALKAHAVCKRVAARTGGAVLPPTYFGFAGGHKEYAGTIMSEEDLVLGNLHRTLDRLIAIGFRVIVVLTGHYPNEQMNAVSALADEITAANPGVRVMGLAEPQAYPGEFRGDHAAKWETSLGLYLFPELVHMEEMGKHADPLYGIYGEDPRRTASSKLGQETVKEIVDQLAMRVEEALEQRTGARK
jgi:creatinine amidohydrolase